MRCAQNRFGDRGSPRYTNYDYIIMLRGKDWNCFVITSGHVAFGVNFKIIQTVNWNKALMFWRRKMTLSLVPRPTERRSGELTAARNVI